MAVYPILIFLVLLYALGYSATRFLHLKHHPLEQVIINLGAGLGIVPLLGTVLNLLRIPIDYRLFLLLALPLPLYDLFKKYKQIQPASWFKLTPTFLTLLGVIVIFSATMFMYHQGAFSYPWLEDDDPWSHARAVKYVSTYKTLYVADGFTVSNFLDPYPPGYDLTLALAYQADQSSMMWTLKFFNLLLLSLGILFFYIFAKEFMGNQYKALFATFILAAVPAFMSHFIWSHALQAVLYFPAFFALEMVFKDKKWVPIASVLVASALLITPTQAFKFGLFFIVYIVLKMVAQKKILWQAVTVGIVGLLLSLSWWGVGIARHGGVGGLVEAQGGLVQVTEQAQGGDKGIFATVKNIFKPTSGTATRVYTFNDFWEAKGQNLINNPVGIGKMVMVLLFLGLLAAIMRGKKLLKTDWLLITLGLFIYTFLGVHGARLPVGLFAFRFWMLFAIPVALLAAEGSWLLFGLLKGMKASANVKLITKGALLLIIIIGVVSTSWAQKWEVNTAMWGASPGLMKFPEMVQGYSWLYSLPAGTPVWSFSHFGKMTGFDKGGCEYCTNEREFWEAAKEYSAEQVHSWLIQKNYQYVVIDFGMVDYVGEERTKELFQEYQTRTDLFTPVHGTKSLIIFKVV